MHSVMSLLARLAFQDFVFIAQIYLIFKNGNMQGKNLDKKDRKKIRDPRHVALKLLLRHLAS